jgi:hypothetical protein
MFQREDGTSSMQSVPEMMFCQYSTKLPDLGNSAAIPTIAIGVAACLPDGSMIAIVATG